MFHAQETLCKADGSGLFSRVFSTARIERANTASFETEVHEVIAYPLSLRFLVDLPQAEKMSYTEPTSYELLSFRHLNNVRKKSKFQIRKQGRIAITIASDETTYLCSLGQRCHGREQRPTLEVASLRVAS
jgi:hypothetical protein